MRYREIILEYDRSKTVANYGNKIAAKASTDPRLRGLDPKAAVDQVIAEFERADPTKNKQYVQWMANQYAKGNLRYEDIYKLTQDLSMFMDNRGYYKRIGKNIDINAYTPATLADLVDGSTNDADVDSDAVSKLKDVDVLYNGPEGTLMIPKTREASCEIGSGTRWCTAARSGKNYFTNYSNLGPLYVWIDRKDKTDGKKFQFHFRTLQFMDARDRPISPERLNYYAHKHPVLKNLFREKSGDILTHVKNYVDAQTDNRDDYDEYHGNDDNPLLDIDDPYASSVPLLSDKDLISLAADATYEKELAAVYYPLINNKPEVKKVLLQQRKKFPKELVDGLKKPVPEYEDYFLQDPFEAYWYSRWILKQPWPKAESVILTSPRIAVEYASTVLKKPWPELEKILADNGDDVLTRWYYSKIEGK